ncbi:MAG: phosphohydrolase [Clostridiales bacterium]|jgi:3',5'-cyclic AMP phosphodiesterase CpdA|nr:phosphohydrolase [Clostridiales bacterium]
MKKNIISSLLLVSVVLLSLFFILNPFNTGQLKVNEESKTSGGEIKVSKEETKTRQKYESISFSVIGDVHSDTARLESAIKDLNNINSDIDLMVMNGDIVDEGIPKYYTTVQNTLTRNKALLPKHLIKNIGNHEFFDYSKTTVNTKEESEVHVSRYLEFAGEEKVYHDDWIKGYHFISLGSEQTNTSDVANVTAFISQEQLNWLEEKLAEEYKSGKPIFVFLHQPINNIPTSQQKGWISTKQNVEIFNILSKYPEVVLFSSHTHTYLVSNNMVYLRQPFTALYTGATHGPLKADEKGVRGYSQESQGVYVEIIDGKLTIRGRDFGKKAWVDEAEFTRDLN